LKITYTTKFLWKIHRHQEKCKRTKNYEILSSAAYRLYDRIGFLITNKGDCCNGTYHIYGPWWCDCCCS